MRLSLAAPWGSGVADRVGSAKTYDAEYVALAVIADSRLLTLDRGT